MKRFGKKGKLSLRFIGPFEVTERIGEVAYRLALPERLKGSGLHDVFHVSMLRQHIRDPKKQIEPEILGIEILADTSVEVEPHCILDRSERVTRRRAIPMVKVQWSSSDETNATWEKEEDVRRDYPHLFQD